MKLDDFSLDLYQRWGRRKSLRNALGGQMRECNRFTREEDEIIVSMAEKGHTAPEIGERLKRPSNTIYVRAKILKKRGLLKVDIPQYVRKSKKPLSDQEHNELLKLWR